MDLLEDVFQAMRVESALYARLEATAPWGLRFRPGQWARFGLVIRGGCWLAVEGVAKPIALVAGDCYVLVRGVAYILRDAPSSPVRECAEVVQDKVGGIVELGGGGAPTTIITGWFAFDELSARPLMEFMPPVLHTRMDQDRTHLLQATLQLLAMETQERGLGSNLIISRLADIVFVQAVRAYVHSADPAELGWLAALADRHVGTAIQAIHKEVARPWTVAELASVAGLSRSAFALRFKERVGEPPLTYLTRWRMFRAGCLLRQSERSPREIAELVGYDSDAAFNKAFKRMTGVAPGQYRKAKRSALS